MLLKLNTTGYLTLERVNMTHSSVDHLLYCVIESTLTQKLFNTALSYRRLTLEAQKTLTSVNLTHYCVDYLLCCSEKSTQS